MGRPVCFAPPVPTGSAGLASGTSDMFEGQPIFPFQCHYIRSCGVGGNVHVCSNVEVRDQLRALFHRCVYLSFLLLRQGLSLGLELADSTKLAGQPNPKDAHGFTSSVLGP